VNNPLHTPFAAWLLAGTGVCLALTRTRLANWSIPAALFLFLASAELACFDGRRHLTDKFDATFFVWGRAIELRAVGGVAIMLCAGPCGSVVAKLMRVRHGALVGAATVGPFGLGLFASSIQLQLSMPTIVHEGTAREERLRHLRVAVEASTWLVSAGTIVSVLVCVGVVVAIARRRFASQPHKASSGTS
jgi:hypothetical protein